MKELSVKEALKVTIANLEKIQVPVGMMKQIGGPLAMNVENLQLCVDALEQAEKEQARAAEAAMDGESNVVEIRPEELEDEEKTKEPSPCLQK